MIISIGCVCLLCSFVNVIALGPFETILSRKFHIWSTARTSWERLDTLFITPSFVPPKPSCLYLIYLTGVAPTLTQLCTCMQTFAIYCRLLAVRPCAKSSFASRPFCVSSPDNIGILSLCTAYPPIWQSCLLILNSVLNLTVSLLPITSSHSYASASDSTFEYWCNINVWLALTLRVLWSAKQGSPSLLCSLTLYVLFVIGSRQTTARWRRRHVTAWRRAVTSLVTSRRRRWRSWPSRTTTRDTSHRADDRTRNWHSLREM